MALVDWNENYSVDIKEIDDQHKKLTGLVNELHDAMMVGKGKEALGKVLNELVDYTHHHFATEEKYFDLYDYPKSETHKEEHKKMLENAAAIKLKSDKGEKVVTIEVMNFLRDWLHDHLLGSDKEYAPFLKSKGMK